VLISNRIHSTRNQINGFKTYINELHKVLLDTNLILSISSRDPTLIHLLDGKAANALHQTVPISMRKEQGIYFTNHSLAEKIASDLSRLLAKGIKVIDPTCGVGNLLLACANYLPIGNNLGDTINIWSNYLFGNDLFEEFILATKLKLILFAAIRSRDVKNIENIVLDRGTFPGLQTKDILQGEILEEKVDCVVVNPPFGQAYAPDNCKWSTGNIQKAGLFFERIMRSAPQDQNIIAILPDVLRSGTRYSKWRKIVASLASSLTLEMSGRFDNEADVDVFVLKVKTGRGIDSVDWLRFDESTEKTTKSVSDYFEVHVGPVVPHRSKEEGPKYPYIHVRNTLAWETTKNINEFRKYRGKVYKPPFVVVHRTSSPRDKYRCVATILDYNSDIAVENHLLILLPKDRSFKKCDELLKILKDDRTNKWMNSRICCRHLTVASVKELPWWSE